MHRMQGERYGKKSLNCFSGKKFLKQLYRFKILCKSEILFH